MSGEPLQYGRDDTPWLRRHWVRTVCWTSGVLAVLALVPTLTARHKAYYVDGVTGSTTEQTTYAFGITPGPVVTVSPLEKRLRSMGATWKPDVNFGGGHTYELIPFNRPRECGLHAPVSEMHLMMQDFVDASTDAEILAFVKILQTGTDAEIRAAVDAAGEKGLDAMAARP